MTEAEKLGYLVNLPRVQAQETLNRGDYDPAAYEAIYQLTLTATGNERLATKARRRALQAFVERETKQGRR